MKEIANFILARMPKVYSLLLKMKLNYNLEKILFLNLVENGDIVFDIGANIGYYTLLFSHLVGNNGEVHGFEPVPITFQKLSQKIYSKKIFNNIYLSNTAAGNKNGNIAIYLPDNDDGQASMANHKYGSWENAKIITEYECKMIKLDDYAESKNIKRLDFIKCDVEGAELMVLQGFSHTISKFFPIIYLEICQEWTKNFNYSPVDVVNFLMDLGYSNFNLVGDHIYQLNRQNIELLSTNLSISSNNLICTIPEIHQNKMKWLSRNAKTMRIQYR